MTNSNRKCLVSAKGTLGGRLSGSLRVYTLGSGAEADIYFSLKLWLAAGQRQQRLSAPAYAR